jgi:hypothetical protein
VPVDEDALSPAVGEDGDCAVLLVSAPAAGDEDALSPAVGEDGDCAVLLVSALVPVAGDWAVPCAVPLAARECDPLVLHAAASTTAAANPMARMFMALPPGPANLGVLPAGGEPRGSARPPGARTRGARSAPAAGAPQAAQRSPGRTP